MDTEARAADGPGWAVPGVGVGGPTGGAGVGPAPGERRPSEDRPGEDGPGEDGSRGVGSAGLADELAGAGGPAHPIVAAMLTCLETLDSVRDTSTATLTTREIRLMLLAVVQLIAAATALKLRLLVAGQAQRIADLTGATTTAAFFAHLTQTRRADASAQVRLAHDLDRRYPLLADALARGQLSAEHTSVAAAALRKLPKDLPADQLDACQRFLVDAAGQVSPDQLKLIGRRLWEVIDPDAAEAKEGKDLQDEEDLARATAYLKSWRNGDGTTGFRGKLPDLHADILLKAIQAFCSPRRRKNPTIPTSQPDDTRHPDTEPPPGPDRPGQDRPGQDGPGQDRRGEPDESDEAQPADDPAALAPPGAAPPGAAPPDPGHAHQGQPPEPQRPEPQRPEPRPPEEPEVPYPVRLGHGLIDLIERLPTDPIPDSGGIPATIVVTMRLDQLLDGLGTATLDTGTTISAGQARRLACQAGIIPVVLDGKSQPLDVGQEQRLHTKHQRIAITVRDQGCVIEGCDRPASQCEFHHPIPFSEGGPTSLENAATLCPHHHHLAHTDHWQLTRQPNGKHRLHRLNRR